MTKVLSRGQIRNAWLQCGNVTRTQRQGEPIQYVNWVRTGWAFHQNLKTVKCVPWISSSLPRKADDCCGFQFNSTKEEFDGWYDLGN